MKQNLFAFIIGVVICLLALKCCDAKNVSNNEQDNKKQIQIFNKNAETIQKNFQREKQHFNKVADSLKTENKNLYHKLQVVRSSLKRQQTHVSSINKNACDTLKSEVLVLNDLTNRQDSLCELNIISLNQAVALRDTQLLVCNKAVQSLYDLQKENLQRQLQLAEDLKRALKANRKKQFENKVLSFGLMVVTGITTTLFIKSQLQ